LEFLSVILSFKKQLKLNIWCFGKFSLGLELWPNIEERAPVEMLDLNIIFFLNHGKICVQKDILTKNVNLRYKFYLL